MKTAIIAATLFCSVAALAGEARANAFVAWEVTDLPWGDTLNIRKYPASHSQKRSAVPDGTVLQMTGRCTGGVDLFDIAGMPAAAQRNAVRYRWCEVWHDPGSQGQFETGWVYGRYIAPY